VDRMAIGTIRRVFRAMDASFDGMVGWRAGDLDRLTDERHAGVVEAVIRVLRQLGWDVVAEATYAVYAERGSIDIFASRIAERAIAIFEIKSDLTTIEATIRKHGEKVRLAEAALGRRWLGWEPTSIARILVFPEDRTVRRRVKAHAATFATAYPLSSRDVRAWLARPGESAGGIWFLTPKAGTVGSQARGGARRVRLPGSSSTERA